MTKKPTRNGEDHRAAKLVKRDAWTASAVRNGNRAAAERAALAEIGAYAWNTLKSSCGAAAFDLAI